MYNAKKNLTISLADKYFTHFAFALYAVICLIKMRAYFKSGRFWAEEGLVFYTNIANSNPIDGLFFLFNGHIELVTNAVILASTLVDFKIAPLITTYLSLSIQLLPIALIVLFRENLNLSKPGTLALILITAGLPQSAEVWANSINLHFHFALLTAIIASIKITEGHPKYKFRSLLLLSGLSGVPANFLAPIYFFLALFSKQKERWIQFLIISTTSLIQLTLLAFNNFGTEQRDMSFPPMTSWLAMLSQTTISPLFGLTIGEEISSILKQAATGNHEFILFGVFCSIPLLYIFIKTRELASIQYFTLIGSALLLAILSIFTSLGDKTLLISAASGGRYFYAPNVLLALFLLSLTNTTKHSPPVFNRYGLYFFTFFLLTTSIGNIKHFLSGPDWKLSHAESAAQKKNTINIWPIGWQMNFFRK